MLLLLLLALLQRTAGRCLQGACKQPQTTAAGHTLNRISSSAAISVHASIAWLVLS
jgi:hypothetical protein